MPRGTVKLLVDKRGYGFLAAAEGPDVFFAHNAVADHGFRRLQLGQTVEYELCAPGGRSSPGPRAKLVRPHDTAGPAPTAEHDVE